MFQVLLYDTVVFSWTIQWQAKSQISHHIGLQNISGEKQPRTRKPILWKKQKIPQKTHFVKKTENSDIQNSVLFMYF